MDADVRHRKCCGTILFTETTKFLFISDIPILRPPQATTRYYVCRLLVEELFWMHYTATPARKTRGNSEPNSRLARTAARFLTRSCSRNQKILRTFSQMRCIGPKKQKFVVEQTVQRFLSRKSAEEPNSFANAGISNV